MAGGGEVGMEVGDELGEKPRHAAVGLLGEGVQEEGVAHLLFVGMGGVLFVEGRLEARQVEP